MFLLFLPPFKEEVNIKLGIIGVPMDLGQRRRGVDMGPTAIRIANLSEKLKELGHKVYDFGNIAGPDRSSAAPGSEKIRYLEEVLNVCSRVADSVSQNVAKGLFPVVLGGDQSVSIGTLAGLERQRRGVLWFDAHGDFNTEKTTPSGSIHGMALAAVLGYGHPKLAGFRGIKPKAVEKNTVLIGGRSFDREESLALEKSNVTVYTMREIDELGIRHVMENAIAVASKGVREVHLSFDVDAVDPNEAPGTGTPVVGGLTYREAQLAMELLYDSQKITSVEVVEVNPFLDHENRTAELAVKLMLSLFGKQILARKLTSR